MKRVDCGVKVDFAPAYELVVSLSAYLDRPRHKLIDLGARWAKDAGKRLSPVLRSMLDDAREHEGLRPGLHYLVFTCPGRRDATGFIEWLSDLRAGELYEIVEPCVPESELVRLKDLAALRDGCAELLAGWDNEYFRTVDELILTGLAREADARREALTSTPGPEVVESATGGVRVEEDGGYKSVVLVPQYHYRPWNIVHKYRNCVFFSYPAEATGTGPGEPPERLVRVGRALSDPSRLKIMRFLVKGPLSFMSLVRCTQLSKSTVHYHLVLLRAARLVRVDVAEGVPDQFSLRPGALADIQSLLEGFLEENET